MPETPAELLVINRAYTLVQWACPHIAKFPRSHRFTLGQRLEHRLYDVLESLLRAKYTRERQPILKTVNLELEMLGFQFRLAKDLRCLPESSYAFAARAVNEIGQMVGGWIKKG